MYNGTIVSVQRFSVHRSGLPFFDGVQGSGFKNLGVVFLTFVVGYQILDEPADSRASAPGMIIIQKFNGSDFM
jgi:hypothetical protein